ncbi:MAG TPA: cyclopropane-fatty-acyl-phospholipid synthase family protein [Burkholderiaceae bacterium]|nr:cyclopropane-fatty-acyl-phospholipid synthase family protein [Burkholderiaceae bacterium]
MSRQAETTPPAWAASTTPATSFVADGPANRRLDTTRFPARARRAFALLGAAREGRLAIAFPDGQQAILGGGEQQADIALRNWKPVDAALERGDIGFAETYIDGDWTTGDPVRLLRFFLRNRKAADRLIFGSLAGRLAYRLRHLARRNSRRGAPRNIRSHYDLGNEFYAIWLDASMSYSSALFGDAAVDAGPARPDALRAAQMAKYARVIDELKLAPASRILEVGCGWGGFAEVAARSGHLVTGLTLSPAQLEFARRRMARQGLPHELVLRDYRDERGRYDGIASIEMFEAVGEKYWPQYFAMLARCLKPGGRACIQTITIDEALFERYRRGTDFIQQYVFPGGMLPSPGAFERAAERGGLKVVERFRFGASYARTLATWRATFSDRAASVRALGFDERFLRTWNFYLGYCEAAFAEHNTDVFQFTLAHR